jgi:hypothetical protein
MNATISLVILGLLLFHVVTVEGLWTYFQGFWDNFQVIPLLLRDPRTTEDWVAFTAEVLEYLHGHPRRDLRRPETRREMLLAGKSGLLHYRQRKLCRERDIECPAFGDSCDD